MHKLLILSLVALLSACGDLLYPTAPDDILLGAALCAPAGGMKSIATKKDGPRDERGYSSYRSHIVCENGVFIVAPSHKSRRKEVL